MDTQSFDLKSGLFGLVAGAMLGGLVNVCVRAYERFKESQGIALARCGKKPRVKSRCSCLPRSFWQTDFKDIAAAVVSAGETSLARMLEILLSGVSTRNYARVLPEIANSVGISRSAVSRQFIKASEEQLKALCERRDPDRLYRWYPVR